MWQYIKELSDTIKAVIYFAGFLVTVLGGFGFRAYEIEEREEEYAVEEQVDSTELSEVLVEKDIWKFKYDSILEQDSLRTAKERKRKHGKH